jgi:hypothetical protein
MRGANLDDGKDFRGMLPWYPWGAFWDWGLSMAGDVATIHPGEFEAGAGVILSTAETNYTITQDAQYIGLQIAYDASIPVLTLVAPTTARPSPDAGNWRTWLYCFRFVETGYAYPFRAHNPACWHASLFAAVST